MTTRGLSPLGARLVRLAPGRVEVVRGRLDLGGAGVDAPVDRPDAARRAAARGRSPRSSPQRSAIVGVGEPRRLSSSQSSATRSSMRAIRAERVRRAVELGPEPGVHAVRQVVERGPRRRGRRVELARAHRLQERLGERAADAHRLADRLHLRAERAVGAGELLEGEARELDDDVVERRLEARRASCRSGRSGSRRACSRPRASRRPWRSDSRSPSTRAPRSARRAGSSRSRAARRSRARARTGCSSRRSRRRPRG